MVSLKQKTITGLFWSSVERFSVQAVQLIIQILIARILSPADFGVIGMLAIFIAISQSFIDSGFSNALIRKTDRTETDNSTVFYFNIAVGLVCYLILFFCAPFIAEFYKTPIIVPITRVLALGIVFNSLAIVQRALLTAKVDFKTQAKASFISVVISGTLGLYLAYNGYGVWALAIQTVVNGFFNTLILWILTKWKPQWVFSTTSFKEMFSFGSKLLLSGLIDTTYINIYTLVIGKIYTANDLGCYAQASNIANFPSTNITGIIGRVTFPLLCELQNNAEQLRYTYRKYLKLSAYIIFPLMIGLAALASPLLTTLLTNKWSSAIILLQIICLSMMWYPIHAINLNLLKVKGRSDLFLRLEIIKKIIGFTILCISVPFGVTWMCVGNILTSIFCLAINTHYTGILINLGFWRQMKDLLPSLLYSLTMGVIVIFVIPFFGNDVMKLVFGCITGFTYYFAISLITKSQELKDIFILLRIKS